MLNRLMCWKKHSVSYHYTITKAKVLCLGPRGVPKLTLYNDLRAGQSVRQLAQFYPVIKKRQEVNTKTEGERSRVSDIIRYI